MGHPIPIKDTFVIVSGALHHVATVEPDLCELSEGWCFPVQRVAGLREQLGIQIICHRAESDQLLYTSTETTGRCDPLGGRLIGRRFASALTVPSKADPEAAASDFDAIREAH